jgi:excisionase family DNA binding protein
MEKLLTLAQVEGLIGRKVPTLRTDIREGRLAVTRLGRGVRVSEASLKRFLAEQRKPHNAR